MKQLDYENRIISSCQFLIDKGFIFDCASENVVRFGHEGLQIELYVDEYGYEVGATFAMPKAGISVNLQSVVGFFGLGDALGVYQAGSIEEIFVG